MGIFCDRSDPVFFKNNLGSRPTVTITAITRPVLSLFSTTQLFSHLSFLVAVVIQ